MAIIKPLQSVTLKNDNGEDIKYDVLTRAEVSGILAAIGATTESTTSGNPLTLASVELLKSVKEKGETTQSGTPTPSDPQPIVPLKGYDKKVVLNGSESENWGVHGSIASWFYLDNYAQDYAVDGAANDFAMASSYKQEPYNTVATLTTGKFAIGKIGADYRLVVKDIRFTTVAEWKAYLAAHPLTVWYRSTSYDPTADQYYAVGADATNGYIGVATEEKIAPLYDGDYVDFVSGVVHREKAKTTLSTGTTWTWDANNVLGYTGVTGAIITNGTTQYNAYAHSNVGKSVSWANRGSGDGWKTCMRYGVSMVCLKSPDITTSDAFNAAISGVPITVVYQLASPTNSSVDLTEDLSALYGSITLNGNGTMDVTYRHG